MRAPPFFASVRRNPLPQYADSKMPPDTEHSVSGGIFLRLNLENKGSHRQQHAAAEQKAPVPGPNVDRGKLRAFLAAGKAFGLHGDGQLLGPAHGFYQQGRQQGGGYRQHAGYPGPAKRGLCAPELLRPSAGNTPQAASSP